MICEIIEPFIILPYGNMQDTIFFLEESLRKDYSLLIDLAYRKLANHILQDNLIRVITNIHEVIIFHIYPTNYREKRSKRIGQNLIVGYIIKKKYLQKKLEYLIYSCNLFFEAIRHCSYIDGSNYNTPSKFLYKINAKHFNEYIVTYLREKRTEMQLITKENLIITNMISDNRLKAVYSFIAYRKTIYGEYWILVDIENIDYYKKLNRSYNIILKD